MRRVASLAESLDAFRREHPIQSVTSGDVLCRYRAARSGRRAVLLLPGAVGDGEAYFLLAPLLRRTHRLIAVSYPNCPDAEAVLVALASVADHEGADSVDLVGGSFGGLVAQAFLRRFPTRVGRVVLSATGPVRPARAETNEKWARRIGALPVGISRGLLRTIVRLSLRKVTEEKSFWREFYFGAIGRLTAEELRNRYRLSAAIDRLGPVTTAGLQGWNGSVLILRGESDRIAHAAARDALETAFPGAAIHTFPGAGHAIAAQHAQEWARVTAAFLAGAMALESRHG